jgi:hypothetical protein
LRAEFVFRALALSDQLNPYVCVSGFIQINKTCISRFADPHQALIFQDAAQPTTETTITPKLLQTLESFPKRRLYLILRVIPITDHMHCPLQTSAAMPLNQFPKSLSIPVLRCANEIVFRPCRGLLYRI